MKEEKNEELPKVQGENEQARAESALRNVVDWVDSEDVPSNFHEAIEGLIAHHQAMSELAGLKEAFNRERARAEQLAQALELMQQKYTDIERKYNERNKQYELLKGQHEALLGPILAKVKVEKNA